MDWTNILGTVQELILTYGLNVVFAILILIIGLIAVKLIVKGMKAFFTRRKFDATLTSFLGSLLHILLLAFVVIAALGQLGVQTTSLVAVIGAAGLAIGLALQGSLANFASGVLIILLHPFKIGDYIEGGGTAGTVAAIGMFTTTLTTPDNKMVTVPNTQVMGGTITNYSAKDQRRIDLVIGVSYDDDIRVVEKLIKEILDAEARVLPEPAYKVAVLELGDSSVNFAVRPWVAVADYWPVRFDLVKEIKLRFDAEGITIPYPQQDVYLHRVEES